MYLLWLASKTREKQKPRKNFFSVREGGEKVVKCLQWIFNEKAEWKRDLLFDAINVNCIIFHSATEAHGNCRMLMRACFCRIILRCRWWPAPNAFFTCTPNGDPPLDRMTQNALFASSLMRCESFADMRAALQIVPSGKSLLNGNVSDTCNFEKGD